MRWNAWTLTEVRVAFDIVDLHTAIGQDHHTLGLQMRRQIPELQTLTF
jgi:hypothetical protein